MMPSSHSSSTSMSYSHRRSPCRWSPRGGRIDVVVVVDDDEDGVANGGDDDDDDDSDPPSTYSLAAVDVVVNVTSPTPTPTRRGGARGRRNDDENGV
jgi:hypothetical protein